MYLSSDTPCSSSLIQTWTDQIVQLNEQIIIKEKIVKIKRSFTFVQKKERIIGRLSGFGITKTVQRFLGILIIFVLHFTSDKRLFAWRNHAYQVSRLSSCVHTDSYKRILITIFTRVTPNFVRCKIVFRMQLINYRDQELNPRILYCQHCYILFKYLSY